MRDRHHRTISLAEDGWTVRVIDQTRLPFELAFQDLQTPGEAAVAITDMVVRGAPAIGVTAALGIALGMAQARGTPRRTFDRICKTFAATRPTAVNLFWAIDRMRAAFDAVADRNLDEIRAALLKEARAIHREDIAANRSMGQHGAALIPPGARVLTHCNAGALATAGYGTALGV